MTLTREEILALDPIELGPAVAEHIFQAKVIGKENFPELRLLIGWFGKEAWKPMKGTWHNAEWRNSEEKAWLDCPRFGEDISAAWEVLNKVIEMGMEINVGFYKKWDCDLDYRGTQWNEQADTAPEAICKTALLAVLGL
ncbi:hypothetical protein MHI32_01535 [Paenibacillus sp. FSL H7-0690]|uniref:BC1872 family protein n=1 Tax=Paenibacillus sp. FSL H7-0690 TaxID=2921437 RepID=UPI0030EEFD20